MTETAVRNLELDIAGRSCAACAARLQKTLNGLDGVTASVNYATEKATVTMPSGYDPHSLVAEVAKAGYTAVLAQPHAHTDPATPADDPELTSLRNRLATAVVLATPVLLLAMVPALQFRNWQWVSLILATPVVAWSGRPFHQAAWANLKHRAATMDTLVSVGTLAAFVWSLYALWWGSAGRPGMRHGFELFARTGDGGANIYLAVAA